MDINDINKSEASKLKHLIDLYAQSHGENDVLLKKIFALMFLYENNIDAYGDINTFFDDILMGHLIDELAKPNEEKT